MKNNVLKEIILVIVALVPIIYLGFVWKQLPESIPIHWNINGMADKWTDKQGLFLTVFLLVLVSYVCWILIQQLGRKKWVAQLGGKFYQIRFAFSVFISLIAIYIIYSAGATITNISVITLLIGSLLAITGNHIHSVKPNYFVGVRTPWTLQNEEVWRKSHQFSSKLLLFSGLFIVAISLFSEQHNFVFFIIIITVVCIASVLHSYLVYKQIA